MEQQKTIKELLEEVKAKLKKELPQYDLTSESECEYVLNYLYGEISKSIKQIRDYVNPQKYKYGLLKESFNKFENKPKPSAATLSNDIKSLSSNEISEEINAGRKHTITYYSLFLGYFGWEEGAKFNIKISQHIEKNYKAKNFDSNIEEGKEDNQIRKKIKKPLFQLLTIISISVATIVGVLNCIDFFKSSEWDISENIQNQSNRTNVVLVFPFDGDEKFTRHKELAEKINDYAIDSNLNLIAEYSDKIIKNSSILGHDIAREYGKKEGAVIVIWGHYYNNSTLRPHITIVNKKKHTFFKDTEKALTFTVKNEANLPNEVLDDPIKIISFLQGYNSFIRGEYTNALKKFRKIEAGLDSTELNSTNIYSFIGDSYLFKYKEDISGIFSLFSAKTYYLKENLLDSVNYYAFQQIGLIYFLQGDFDASLDKFTKALYLGAEKHEIYNLIGLAFDNYGNKEKALSNYEESLKYDKKYFPALMNLGLWYSQKGNQSEALKNYFKANKNSRNQYQLWNNIGNSYDLLGNNKKALYWYNKVLDIDSLYVGTIYNIGNIYKKASNFQLAIDYYHKAIKIDSMYMEARINLANTYCDMDSTNIAIECYLSAINLNRKRWEEWHEKGLKYRELDKHAESLICYHQEATIWKKSYNLWYNLAEIYIKNEQIDKASKCFKKAMDISPEITMGWLMWGAHMIDFGRIEEAEPMMKKVVALGGKDIGNLFLGHIYYKQGNFTTAIKHYELSKSNYKSISDFMDGFNKTFRTLEQYGFSEKDYIKLLDQIGK